MRKKSMRRFSYCLLIPAAPAFSTLQATAAYLANRQPNADAGAGAAQCVLASRYKCLNVMSLKLSRLVKEDHCHEKSSLCGRDCCEASSC